MISTEWLRSGRRVKVLVGHYGSGKTELAVNMALALRKSAPVMLVDLDIVNPFFRSAEVKPLLAEHGVEIVYPAYALSGVDIPILPAEVERAFTTDGFSVFDVGGDDDGAVALGGFSALLERRGYSMLYVVNPYRELEPDPEEDAALLERIQQSSRLRVTYLVNNANLGPETTPQLVREAAPYLGELSRITGIPVLWTAVESRYAGQFPPDGILPIEVYVKLPWDEEEKR